MSNKIEAVKGMNDILPEDISHWHDFEKLVRSITKSYGYQEIRTPVVEKTELFARTIGEVTDIVEKEMYTFLDRNQLSLSLRPEGTAGCIRAAIEHNLLYNQSQKLWYMEPLFRYEQPQKGRYRQFHQFGVEALGFAGPDIDLEIIALSANLLKHLGLRKDVTLQINSLGTKAMRELYKTDLINYFNQHLAELDADSQRRLATNPLRILDSKNPQMQSLISEAPKLSAYIEDKSLMNFEMIQQGLTALDIPYEVNLRLVRGLDYYSDLVFEWVTPYLGSQSTVCAGGRYDQLIEELGGQPTPAIGFGMGCERIIELRKERLAQQFTPETDVYWIIVGEDAARQGIILAEQVRAKIPSLAMQTHCGGGSFKSQFKKADKSGAKIAFILGDDEVAKQQIAVKFLRESREQISLAWTDMLAFFENYFNVASVKRSATEKT